MAHAHTLVLLSDARTPCPAARSSFPQRPTGPPNLAPNPPLPRARALSAAALLRPAHSLNPHAAPRPPARRSPALAQPRLHVQWTGATGRARVRCRRAGSVQQGGFGATGLVRCNRVGLVQQPQQTALAVTATRVEHAVQLQCNIRRNRIRTWSAGARAYGLCCRCGPTGHRRLPVIQMR